jgi:hypothetical protein
VGGAAAAEVARQAAVSLEQVARAGQLLAEIVGGALQRPLLAVGVALAVINRQAILSGIAGLAKAFAAAAAAAGTYSVSAGTAAVATNILKASIRGLAAATGIGLVAVGLSLAAEAAVNYATRATTSADDVSSQVADMNAAIAATKTQFDTAGNAAQAFGAKVQAAVKIPDLSIGDIAQDSINSAQSAIAGLAKELGGTVALPRELVAQFNSIQNLAERANGDLVNQRFLLGQLVQESNRFADSVRAVTERRQADARAAQESAEATRKAAEDARKRTQELASQGLGGLEQSRLTLAQDLLAIDRERLNAEQALADARRTNDIAGIAAGRERLQLVGNAAETAREQDRQRQLQALGIDNNLLRPAQTIATQFEALRAAIGQGLLKPDQINAAVQNIAKEGLDARREIARELSRPSEQALQVSDIRSSQGISQFFATGRQDPAIEQRREQLQRLSEIRREIAALRNIPVEIR